LTGQRIAWLSKLLIIVNSRAYYHTHQLNHGEEKGLRSWGGDDKGWL